MADPNTKTADIYSLGVTIAESIGAGKCSVDQVLASIRHSQQTELKISPQCADLISMMIKEDPSERPNIIVVHSHQWITHFSTKS